MVTSSGRWTTTLEIWQWGIGSGSLWRGWEAHGGGDSWWKGGQAGVLGVMAILIGAGFVEQWLNEVGVLRVLWFQPISRHWFGPNKTWRPFVVLPPICAFLAWAAAGSLGVTILGDSITPRVAFLIDGWKAEEQWVRARLGFEMGIVWLLAELPHSFVKRRLGIRAGAATGLLGWVADHLDSTSGVAAYLVLLRGWAAADVFPLLPLAALLHWFHNLLCAPCPPPPPPSDDL